MNTTETMTTDYRAAAAAGLGKGATSAFSVCAGTATVTAEHDGVWVRAIVDAAPDAADATDGSLGAAPPLDGDRRGYAALAGRDIARIIGGILPAADTESSRYALGGALVEIAEGGTVQVVATDGRRLHAGHFQPAGIEGAASPIVPVAQWKAFEKAIRATLRVTGINGRKVTAAIDRGVFTITVSAHAATGGEVVSLRWLSAAGDGLITVEATALAVAGRFPRWRDCIPAGGESLAVNVAAVAGAVADYDRLHRAAVKAGKAAWKVEREERKRRRQYHGGQYRHPLGIEFHRAGMIGHGAEWSSVVPASPVPVKLDHTYVSDALAGAAAWGATVADIAATDTQSAVLMTTGEFGPRFTAVIMPLAAD